MHAIYMTIFLKKKKTKGGNMYSKKYRNFSEQENDKKRQYVREGNRHFSKKALTFFWKYKKLFFLKKAFF